MKATQKTSISRRHPLTTTGRNVIQKRFRRNEGARAAEGCGDILKLKSKFFRMFLK